MKCPLLAFAWGNEGGKEPLVYPDCLKEECAWWSPTGNECALTTIADELHWTSERINAVATELKRGVRL